MGRHVTDITGEKFGGLTVTAMSLVKKGRDSQWYCDCDCGNTGILMTRSHLSHIRRRGNNSCKCKKPQLFDTKSPTKRLSNNPNIKDITGKKYAKGNIKVLRQTYKRNPSGRILWECLCGCGTKFNATASAIKGGHTTSCGCKRIGASLVGKKYGLLTVIKMLKETDSRSNILIACRCKCGNPNIFKTSRNAVLHGNTRSCGCLRKGTDLVGERYGFLLVTAMSSKTRGTNKKKKYRIGICTCLECNSEGIEVDVGNLQSGNAKSCGCLNKKVKEMSGKYRGRLTVVGRAPNRANGHTAWYCDCYCGSTNHIVTTCNLNQTKGATSSCGCLHKDVYKKVSHLKGKAGYKEAIKALREENKRRVQITITCNVGWEESKVLLNNTKQITNIL